MTMFAIGMLVMWFILGGLVYFNDLFSLNWGIELFDGWLGIVICFPWIVVLFPLMVVEYIYEKKFKKKH